MFFPAEIHESACKLTCGIHFPAWISACGNTPKSEYFRTLGNPQFLVYFHMRKCTISCEFPHGEKRFYAGADLHILMCISTCGNSLKTVQIRIRGNTLFLIWEFTLNCVSPHATKICVKPHSGYMHFLVHFHKWKFTIISVYPHMRKIKF